MTTMAYDGKTIAIDSQVSCGDAIVMHADKCIAFSGGMLFGSGDRDICYQVAEWLGGGMDGGCDLSHL